MPRFICTRRYPLCDERPTRLLDRGSGESGILIKAARISDSIGFSACRKGSTKPTVLSTIFRKSANSGDEAFAW